jgi:hypothetical protein
MPRPPVSGDGTGAEPGRDPRLATFARGGTGDTCPPGPELAVTAAELSGPDWRCAGATDDELTGLLGRWAAVESWATASKLGVVRFHARARPRIQRTRGRRDSCLAGRGPCVKSAPPGVVRVDLTHDLGFATGSPR